MEDDDDSNAIIAALMFVKYNEKVKTLANCGSKGCMIN